MGYTTEFKGRFKFSKPVSPELADFINKFAESRHVTRDINAYKKSRPDWASRCFNGNPGKDGEYVADESWMPSRMNAGKFHEDYGTTDYNRPPGNCPGLWCQWIVSKDRKYLEWDGGEKFHKYAEWLEYLIENFIAPSGYVLNGEVEYQGEDSDDRGTIRVSDNRITILN